MDTSVLHTLNGFLVRHDGVEDPLVFYVNLAEILFLAMLVLAFLLAGRRRPEIRRAAVAAGLSAGLGLAAAQVITRIVDRPRPFVAHPASVHLFAHHAADPGFPSDHATAAFAIGVALLLRNRRWGAVVLVFATILAVGRVAMGVHYPTDVIGGAVLGTLAALVLFWPPVRELLNRLADLAGRVLDGVLQGILHPQDSSPV
jgi:undecaprenyl-diphosphatase